MNSTALVTPDVLSAFNLPHDCEISVLSGGHINYTFLARHHEKSIILQRINSFVFPNPAHIMENICSVTSFLREKIISRGGNPERECLTVLPTTDGNMLYVDKENQTWRCVLFIQDTAAHESASNLDMLKEAGFAFGDFQNLLRDFQADSLHEIIKDFHNTPARYSQLMEAVQNNPVDRLKTVTAELDFCNSRKEDCSWLYNQLSANQLPLRVTHNDTKMSNVLMDNVTNKATCVIDLDTVMPGLTAYDFGDSIRAGASTAAEDEVDLSKVNFSLPHYDAYTEGFLKACGKSLTDLELKSLPYGAKLMTLEVGMRFLADYLNGDVYFRTSYPQHNLDRARNQFKLVADMEKHYDEMQEIVYRYC
ncbi:phosphotransferase enzyme family protein [Scatolibacter rhodanostii]|uniref:phosphotransferase enzyme family protein n=1 Tax=Scatolibacter rhodanostii TaxID=2014781 RepID=UPI000C0876D3|nr:phosphotransferase [Scatolibacter rhodanostii]